MSKEVVDPVCGMEIIANEAAAQSTYQERTYYFCAPGCKVQFDQNPEEYVQEQDTQPSV